MWAFIGAAFSWIAGVLGTAATAIATAAWSAIVAIWNVLKETGHVISLFGRNVWSFLGGAWDRVFKPFWTLFFEHPLQTFKALWKRVLRPALGAMNAWVDKAHEWLKVKFGPILCWLYQARQFLDRIYKTYIRPVLDLIDVARAFLRILETFHIQWAQALDNALGRLEGWITDKFSYLQGRINQAIGIIDRIVDFDGLFSRLVLLRSQVKYAKEQWRILTAHFHKPLTPGQEQQAKDDLRGKKLSAAKADIRAYVRTRSGADAAMLDEMIVIWRNYLNAG